MHYPLAIEAETDTTAFGIVAPDLPGCFSAGDTLDEAMAAVEEAAAAWVDARWIRGCRFCSPAAWRRSAATSGMQA